MLRVSHWPTDDSPVPAPPTGDSSGASSWTPGEWGAFLEGIIGATVRTIGGIVQVAGPGPETGTFTGSDGNVYHMDPPPTADNPPPAASSSPGTGTLILALLAGLAVAKS